MKVLVLGATGNLGSNSAFALKAAGHDVVACGRREVDNVGLKEHGCEFIGGFLLENPECYKKLPTDFDAVVNMAGALPAHAGMEIMPYVQSILFGMANLLEWMRKGQCRRIIFNTTPLDLSYLFGSKTPVDPDSVRSFPKNGSDHAIYAICKNWAVDILEHYKIKFGFKPCVFRHRTIYQWTDDPSYFVNGEKRVMPWRIILQKCIDGDPVEAWGDPDVKKELLYIDDFTSAICMAVESDACGMFNLPGVKKYTMTEMIQGLAHAFREDGGDAEVMLRPDKVIANELILDGTKTERELGWRAQISWPEACLRMRAVRDGVRM